MLSSVNIPHAHQSETNLRQPQPCVPTNNIKLPINELGLKNGVVEYIMVQCNAADL